MRVSCYFNPKRSKTTRVTVVLNFFTSLACQLASLTELIGFENESTESTSKTGLLPSQLSEGE